MVKWTRIVIILICASAIFPLFEAHASGIVTIQANTIFRMGNGDITQTLNGFYNRIVEWPANNTIRASVAGLEANEGPSGLVYSVSTTGSLQIDVLGGQPTRVICGSCSKSYNGYEEVITYGGGASDSLTLLWSCPPFCIQVPNPPAQESKKVLFLDDFLTGTIADQGWTIDLYQSPSTQPGIYTTSGYLAMRARSTSNLETVHVTIPEYVSSSYGNYTAVKRKLTAAAFPFQQKENPATASLRIGFAPLFTTGAYPGYSPNNTPNVNSISGLCSDSATAADNVGLAYVYIDNFGVVTANVCGSPSGTKASQSLGTINPLLYTAVTVETYGVFCSNCSNNLLPNTGWVYFRIYQEDSSHNIIKPTDQNYNFTATTFPQVSPLTGTLYTFISQSNSNNAATSQTSYIDIVQVQNYGSPVCLFGCLPPIIDITTLQPLSSVWAALVTLANLLGNGDLAWGSFLLYAGLCLGIIVPSVAISKSFILAAMEFLGITGLMLTAGLLGTVWIFAIALGMGYIGYAIIKKMFLSSGNAIMSGGGSEE